MADPSVGLPYAKDAYVTNPDTADPARAAYEVFDPQSGKVLEGCYVVGWARKASEGLVGIARKDGEDGVTHVLRYLESAPEKPAPSPEAIRKLLAGRGLQIVQKEDLPFLTQAEQKQAQERGRAWFKFADDAAMLAAIEQEKALGIGG